MQLSYTFDKANKALDQNWKTRREREEAARAERNKSLRNGGTPAPARQAARRPLHTQLQAQPETRQNDMQQSLSAQPQQQSVQPQQQSAHQDLQAQTLHVNGSSELNAQSAADPDPIQFAQHHLTAPHHSDPLQSEVGHAAQGSYSSVQPQQRSAQHDLEAQAPHINGSSELNSQTTADLDPTESTLHHLKASPHSGPQPAQVHYALQSSDTPEEPPLSQPQLPSHPANQQTDLKRSPQHEDLYQQWLDNQQQLRLRSSEQAQHPANVAQPQYEAQSMEPAASDNRSGARGTTGRPPMSMSLEQPEAQT